MIGLSLAMEEGMEDSMKERDRREMEGIEEIEESLEGAEGKKESLKWARLKEDNLEDVK